MAVETVIAYATICVWGHTTTSAPVSTFATMHTTWSIKANPLVGVLALGGQQV
jgi:hypothetical protein